MSQARPPSSSVGAAPLSQELNKEVEHFDGDNASVEKVLEQYTDLPPEKQRGRPVLSHQIPQSIAKELLTALPLTLLYRYNRETEATVAWKVGDTTKALIRYDATSRDEGPWYMLPPLGEAQLDLRWMMLQSVFREIPFMIDYLPEGTVRSILQTTRPEHRAGIETLLAEHHVSEGKP